MISTSATTPTTTATPPELINRMAWKAGVLGALNLLTAVLAVRLTLLVSVCGASLLAWLALTNPDPYRLGTLGVYGVVVVLPLIWLASRR